MSVHWHRQASTRRCYQPQPPQIMTISLRKAKVQLATRTSQLWRSGCLLRRSTVLKFLSRSSPWRGNRFSARVQTKTFSWPTMLPLPTAHQTMIQGSRRSNILARMSANKWVQEQRVLKAMCFPTKRKYFSWILTISSSGTEFTYALVLKKKKCSKRCEPTILRWSDRLLEQSNFCNSNNEFNGYLAVRKSNSKP